jgi:hypothetical protein
MGLIHEDHVIQLVDRFEADDERRVAVLFEHRRGKKRRLETVRRVMADDAPEAAQRGAAGWRLGVVPKRIQVALDGERCAQPCDEPTLRCCEFQSRRSSSATSSAGVQSDPE